jgi:hypothetical protein
LSAPEGIHWPPHPPSQLADNFYGGRESEIPGEKTPKQKRKETKKTKQICYNRPVPLCGSFTVSLRSSISSCFYFIFSATFLFLLFH